MGVSLWKLHPMLTPGRRQSIFFFPPLSIACPTCQWQGVVGSLFFAQLTLVVLFYLFYLKGYDLSEWRDLLAHGTREIEGQSELGKDLVSKRSYGTHPAERRRADTILRQEMS